MIFTHVKNSFLVSVRIYDEVTPPGYWGSGAENIHVISNFVLGDDLKTILAYAGSINTWLHLDDNWNDRVHSFEMIQHCNLDMANFLKSKTDMVREVISHTLQVGLNKVVPSIVRWRVGNCQPPHADKQNVDGSPNSYPENDIASLVYINDDYEGGQIYFPNQNLQFKPASGSLVFFPGDINYLHGVTEVTKGIRYTMPNFWSITNTGIVF